ncbi:hypothetical protein KG088_16685 [Halomonas sp. TRM85114]|uniref:hypothetical protein n=1 Tax=Halomonas jincaotanensis TaxID=2810616 RepID=UPI001BD5BFC1|nr:hypothetical protein [Halomonas jincaotanensis]MBS9405254.1 hypothetical protein [Halomonas jincaotanensis]
MIRFSDVLRASQRASQHTSAPTGLRASIRLSVLAACGAALMGCAAQPGADLPPYGDSVRHMKELQVYQPGDEVTPLSGEKAAEAMRAYRQPASGTQRGSMSPVLP